MSTLAQPSGASSGAPSGASSGAPSGPSSEASSGASPGAPSGAPAGESVAPDEASSDRLAGAAGGGRRSLRDNLRDNLLGGPGRVLGADIARGIAVLGMFTAHVGVTSDDLATFEGWLSLAHGRSSILFATVAGLSLALVTGGSRPLAGEAMRTARARILVRVVLLLALVAVLDLFGTRVLLILGFYAAYFVLALPFLRMPPARLAAISVGIAVVGPVLVYYGPEVLARAGLRAPHDGSGAATDFLLTGHYPALVWMAYVLAGLALGRCDLRSPTLHLGLVAGGFGLAALTSVASAVMVADAGGLTTVEGQVAVTSSQYVQPPPTWSDPWPPLAGLYLEGPHDDTTFEALGSGGFALGVLGLCLLLGSVARGGAREGTQEGKQEGGLRRVARGVVLTVTTPLAAVGALALTVYSLQIVTIWWWTRTYWDLLDPATNTPLGWMVVVTLVLATAWRALLGRGPLERLFGWVAKRAFPDRSASRSASSSSSATS
ncbi:heparan-alpha-glucosaminide N-acetyltransferase domain-containing protein [Promicromonospora sukumoe]|uniref:heparan-alpha-glucosaminide N-acetyltransferase domain-containing protein n=1 Tax=Promicromonospora sukumoe TaxID=88382 RepID=UPI00036312C8|nr:heparan-alpha-glucosaminide N-acetyltransferase domain-containing protein [Promicromonospora sukumoe]